MTPKSILSAWSHLSIRQSGEQWIIAGYDPYGKFRLGHREDAIGLARDLVEIAEKDRLDTPPQIFDVQKPDSPSSPLSEDGGEMQPAANFASETGEAAGSQLHGSPPLQISPLYSGVSMSDDKISKMRAEMMLAIDERAGDILADADVDPARQAYLTNGRMLRVLTDAEIAELDRLEGLGSWRDRVHAHASALKIEVAGAGADWLEIFDVGEGWPSDRENRG